MWVLAHRLRTDILLRTWCDLVQAQGRLSTWLQSAGPRASGLLLHPPPTCLLPWKWLRGVGGAANLTIPTTWGTPPYAGGAHFLFLPLPVCQHCHELSAALQKKQNRFQRHYVTDRDMGHCEVCSIRITELVSNEAAASPISRLPLRIPNTWPQAFSKAATR